MIRTTPSLIFCGTNWLILWRSQGWPGGCVLMYARPVIPLPPPHYITTPKYWTVLAFALMNSIAAAAARRKGGGSERERNDQINTIRALVRLFFQASSQQISCNIINRWYLFKLQNVTVIYRWIPPTHLGLFGLYSLDFSALFILESFSSTNLVPFLRCYYHRRIYRC